MSPDEAAQEASGDWSELETLIVVCSSIDSLGELMRSTTSGYAILEEQDS